MPFAGFNAANGLSGISTRQLLAPLSEPASTQAMFQCRERLKWDFYPDRTAPPSPNSPRSTSFNAANGLSGISTRGRARACRTRSCCILFQCRERLKWDFYQNGARFAALALADGFNAANGLSGISTGPFLTLYERKNQLLTHFLAFSPTFTSLDLTLLVIRASHNAFQTASRSDNGICQAVFWLFPARFRPFPGPKMAGTPPEAPHPAPSALLSGLIAPLSGPMTGSKRSGSGDPGPFFPSEKGWEALPASLG